MLVLVALAVAVYFSLQQRNNEAEERQRAFEIKTVSGLIGSEKKDFFDDADVKAILKSKYKLDIDYETVGSRRIAVEGGAKGTVDKYDFAFPAGTPAAEKIRRDFNSKSTYRVFFTPMTIASWQPVVQVLENNGIVKKHQDYYGILDMAALANLMENNTRWQDVPNNTSFQVGRKVLVKSTNILSSNSAAMYLSLASYLANNNNIVSDDEQINTVIPKVAPLFTSQGFLAGSSATPFEDYLIKGMGNSPLVMIYESQFLYQASLHNGSIRDDMVLLYPEPTIFTQHTLLAMTEAGKTLGDALSTDAELQKLAIKHGFRSNDTALVGEFQKNVQANGLKDVPANLNEVIDPPSYEILEKMIGKIEQQLN